MIISRVFLVICLLFSTLLGESESERRSKSNDVYRRLQTKAPKEAPNAPKMQTKAPKTEEPVALSKKEPKTKSAKTNPPKPGTNQKVPKGNKASKAPKVKSQKEKKSEKALSKKTKEQKKEKSSKTKAPKKESKKGKKKETQPPKSPSTKPSAQPSSKPSLRPSARPSSKPSLKPSVKPSVKPSLKPSSKPSLSIKPSLQPSSKPSLSIKPSLQPSSEPSLQPSSDPTLQPSSNPSLQPSSEPSFNPSAAVINVLEDTFLQPIILTGVTTLPNPNVNTMTTSQKDSFCQQKVAEANAAPNASGAQITCDVTGDVIKQVSRRRYLEGRMLQSTFEQEVEFKITWASQTVDVNTLNQEFQVIANSPEAAANTCSSMEASGIPCGEAKTIQLTTLRPSVSMKPSVKPSGKLSSQPSVQPSVSTKPSSESQIMPSSSPSVSPSASLKPTIRDFISPSTMPSSMPTSIPSPPPNSESSNTPSMEPSREPSAEPSLKPSIVPVAPAIISLNKLSFTDAEPVIVSFFNPSPTTKDYIGIYVCGQTSSSYYDWTCGSSTCTTPVSSGSVTFASLAAGCYTAALQNNNDIVLATSSVFNVEASRTATVSTDKSSYGAGESVVASFTNSLPTVTDWIGVYDCSNLDTTQYYDWTCGSSTCTTPLSSGSLTWELLPSGCYQCILHDNTDAIIAQSSQFNIADPTLAPTRAPTTSIAVTPNKLEYLQGEPIIINFVNVNPTTQDWIGLYECGLTDTVTTYYEFTCGSSSCTTPLFSGSVTWSVLPNGCYTAVLADNTDAQIAFSSDFTVTAGNQYVSSDKTLYSVGEPIIVSWSVNFPTALDWIALYDCATQTNIQDYDFTGGTATGSMIFTDVPAACYIAWFMDSNDAEKMSSPQFNVA